MMTKIKNKSCNPVNFSKIHKGKVSAKILFNFQTPVCTTSEVHAVLASSNIIGKVSVCFQKCRCTV